MTDSILTQLLDWERWAKPPTNKMVLWVLQGRFVTATQGKEIRAEAKKILPVESWGSLEKFQNWSGTKRYD